MITRRTIKYLAVLLMLTTLLMAMSFAPSVLAANFPLEIINIKPAGTGNPAIPSTNRIFRAYPGLEYNIRPAVIGGLYPFTYSLGNAPAGMTINASTGEITWPNPQSNSSTITLSVTDAEGTTVNTTWAITVTTSDFLFVDSSYSGTQTGSISQPYNSLTNLLAGSGTTTSIVYFRSGSYSLYEYNPIGSGDMYLAGKPHTWIGYPGETVTFTGESGAHLRSDTAIYLDNLNFNNFSNHGIMLWGGHHYQTIRRCTFANITSNSFTNNNYGFIYATSGGVGYYSVIQDNDLSNFTGASAIGSLYGMHKLLIENNCIHDNGGNGVSGFNAGISPKLDTDYLTIRGNRVIMSAGYAFGNNNLNSTMVDTAHVDVSFNLFMDVIAEGARGVVHIFNGFNSLSNFYYYRNTMVGDIKFEFLDGGNCGGTGPWNLYNNVIVNPNADGDGYFTHNYISYGISNSNAGTSPWNCISDSNNLKGLPTSNVIDSNGNLTPSFISYLGTHGHQTSLLPTAPKVFGIVAN